MSRVNAITINIELVYIFAMFVDIIPPDGFKVPVSCPTVSVFAFNNDQGAGQADFLIGKVNYFYYSTIQHFVEVDVPIVPDEPDGVESLLGFKVVPL